ncbi:hypothetical protein [Vibrio gallaecicus]|nr:hypothetical protein [Vibrio gallaecicus]MDN3616414.1 hypothetical protein [Vibrio gallaecicus]
MRTKVTIYQNISINCPSLAPENGSLNILRENTERLDRLLVGCWLLVVGY